MSDNTTPRSHLQSVARAAQAGATLAERLDTVSPGDHLQSMEQIPKNLKCCSGRRKVRRAPVRGPRGELPLAGQRVRRERAIPQRSFSTRSSSTTSSSSRRGANP